MSRRICYILLLIPALLTAQEDVNTDSLFITRFTPFTAYELTKDQISRLPVRGLFAYLQIFNGVVIQDNNIHIRGGRDDETAYFVNGFSTMNPLDNSNAMYVIPEAVERLRVVPGFFPARFGGVNSGLVFTDLKKGTPDYRFAFDFQTDKFAEAGEQFLDTYSYRDHIFTVTARGPLYLSDMYFFVALENTNIGDAAKRFSSAFSFEDLIDQHPRFHEEEEPPVEKDDDSKLTRHSYKQRAETNDDVPDTISLVYPDGFTPFNNRNSWHVNATMQYDRKPFYFDLTLLYNWEKAFANDRPMLEILNRRQDYMQYNKWLAGLKMTHEINRQMKYDVSFSYFDNRSEKYDAYFGNDWKLWADSAAVARSTGGDITYIDDFSNGPWSYWFYGFNFYPNGTAPGNYEKNVQNYWSLATNWQWQPAKRHALTFGADYRKYVIRQYNIDPRIMGYLSDYDPFPKYSIAVLLGNTLGYNPFGEEIENGVNGPREPVFAALYLQDQIQSGEFTLHVGLRYDYLKSDAYSIKSINNIDIDINTGLVKDSEWYIKDAIEHISPRLGVEWSPAANIRYYWNYGQFIQLPRFDQYYYNAYQYASQVVWGGYYYYQPIGFALDPVYTKKTEFGLNYKAGGNVQVHFVGYVKMTKGLTRIERVRAEPGAMSTTYWKVTNGDRSISKGLEFTLMTKRFKRFSSRFMYSLSTAEGTGSDETSYYGAVYRGTRFPRIDSPLDFNRTHSGSVMLDYRFGPHEGGIFTASGINLLTHFSSGHPYTYSDFSCG